MVYRAYEPNDYRERKEFWEELYGLHTIYGPKWCLGEDFIVVRFSHEKSPPSSRTRSVRLFDEFMRELELRDLALQIPRIIKVWNKEVFGDTRIIKKEVVDKIVEIDKKEGNRLLDVGERELRLKLRNQLEEIQRDGGLEEKMKFRWIKE